MNANRSGAFARARDAIDELAARLKNRVEFRLLGSQYARELTSIHYNSRRFS